MLLKIQVKDSISGPHTPFRMSALEVMHEELFYIDPHTFTENQLEVLTLYVEQKCNYKKCFTDYYVSTDGLHWEHGVLLAN